MYRVEQLHTWFGSNWWGALPRLYLSKADYLSKCRVVIHRQTFGLWWHMLNYHDWRWHSVILRITYYVLRIRNTQGDVLLILLLSTIGRRALTVNFNVKSQNYYYLTFRREIIFKKCQRYIGNLFSFYTNKIIITLIQFLTKNALKIQ